MLLDYLGWALNVITNILLRSLKKFSDYSNLTIKPKKKKKKIYPHILPENGGFYNPRRKDHVFFAIYWLSRT